ncbi:hypothetical protein PR048_024444 [Dryococelus australis]|uniref:Uncharacterized protein n=1 Tax=Dryococelus australis TaxID=614101 RepID=A0ABQ9GNM6_9NEOP|nr:hypothetical protein PR048_024444 [Dryococelus australis]
MGDHGASSSGGRESAAIIETEEAVANLYLMDRQMGCPETPVARRLRRGGMNEGSNSSICESLLSQRHVGCHSPGVYYLLKFAPARASRLTIRSIDPTLTITQTCCTVEPNIQSGVVLGHQANVCPNLGANTWCLIPGEV